jgi:hypothetical protein
MKATLEFTLPEEHDEHMNAVRGGDWRLAFYKLHQYLFRLNDSGATSTTEKDLSEATEILEELNLSLWD